MRFVCWGSNIQKAETTDWSGFLTLNTYLPKKEQGIVSCITNAASHADLNEK